MSKKNKKASTIEELDTKLEKKFDDLALMIAKGFENTASKRDLEDVRTDIAKVDDRLKVVETKLDRALYTEVVHLEARLRKVEEKVGIKPAK